MEPKQTSSGPTYYNGEFRHGLDEKRRLQVPAKWRPGKSGTELTLLLWPKSKAGACLRVLPPHKMADLVRDIDALPNSHPNKTTLKRFIGSKSAQVTLDTVGRICIPEELAKAAAIGEQAVLVGLLDKFEIWSTDRYVSVATADEVMAQEAFKEME
jgi:MraZ protein